MGFPLADRGVVSRLSPNVVGCFLCGRCGRHKQAGIRLEPLNPSFEVGGRVLDSGGGNASHAAQHGRAHLRHKFFPRIGVRAECFYTLDTLSANPLLPDSLAAIALPAFYAEQLHGILYTESSQPHDFSDEEVLLLRTLADLIAGVLHNALAFQRAQAQAVTDGLTGLKNHSFFATSLKTCCKDYARAEGVFTVIFMDLDGFKAVNDGKGHLKGDEVLRAVANILRKSVEGTSVIARNGGDEFAVLLMDCGAKRALLSAEKIKSQLGEDAFLIENGVTASIGVAVFPQHGRSASDLLKAADSAMYEAKKQGGNRVKVASPFQ
jgi:diguanylate cyclase (GGDEF)-like protein